MVVTHAILSICATIALLIALTTLPLTYCVLALHVTACISQNAHWALLECFSRSNTVTVTGIILLLLSCLVKAFVMALLLIEPPISTIKDGIIGADPASQDDWLVTKILAMVDFSKGNTDMEQLKYQVGVIAAMTAGSAYATAYALTKDCAMREDSKILTFTGKRMISLILSLGVCLIIAVVTTT